MTIAIGLDIGGTKIAGAVFDGQGAEIAQAILPTPKTYESFLDACRNIVEQLEQKSGAAKSIGVCSPYADANISSNMPMLVGKNLREDLENIFERRIPFGNDANCATLAEAILGAGKNFRTVFGLIMGTGIGGGFVYNGHLWTGANGLVGEIGHLPMPYYEESDGERIPCACGQKGCIEKFIAGAGLSRLYEKTTGDTGDARKIGALANEGNAGALKTLDHYYNLVAKAMVAVFHSFDPDIITVSGGLNALPGLYTEIPKRWGRYAINKNPVTQFVPASFGAMAGLRGAAWLGKNA